MQTPSVGRIVHYVSHGTPILDDGSQAFPSVCRAAIITAVPPGHADDEHGRVSLAVLNPTGMFFHQAVPHAEPDSDGSVWAGSWHWPERV